MEKDIRKKIELEFNKKSLKAIKRLNKFEKKYQLSSRISRCLVHLSKGDIKRLKSHIIIAEQDWRDVIVLVEEFDESFDGNLPFTFVTE